jgi:hypothetical protein
MTRRLRAVTGTDPGMVLDGWMVTIARVCSSCAAAARVPNPPGPIAYLPGQPELVEGDVFWFAQPL